MTSEVQFSFNSVNKRFLVQENGTNEVQMTMSMCPAVTYHTVLYWMAFHYFQLVLKLQNGEDCVISN